MLPGIVAAILLVIAFVLLRKPVLAWRVNARPIGPSRLSSAALRS